MLITFSITFFLNLYLIIFGSKKIKKLLEQKASFKKYIDEIFKSSESAIGKKNTTILKIILAIMIFVSLIANFIFFIKLIIAFLLGIYSAKRVYQVPVVSNYINKALIYIIRAFKK